MDFFLTKIAITDVAPTKAATANNGDISTIVGDGERDAVGVGDEDAARFNTFPYHPANPTGNL